MAVRLQILGALRVWRDGVEVDVGPPQQAAVLALLLARAGQPISTDELIDLIWDDHPPASARNVLRKYVGGLRRRLEPDLPVREAGSYLLRRGNGYLCAAEPGTSDLATFREHTRAAAAALAEQQHAVALDCYVQALGLWTGPAGAGLAHGTAAQSVFARLNEEFFDACAAAADLAVDQARPERVLGPLRLAAEMAPLHERVQAGLVSALGAAGQQAEALAVFRAVRSRLADDLGVDPGPVLAAAHARVLAPAPTPPRGGGVIGRARELAELRRAVGAAIAGGTGTVLIEGEPGAGKTCLLEQASADAAGAGALVVWGHGLEGDATPSMWPWVQALGAVLTTLPVAAREEWAAGELGPLLEPHRVDRGLPERGARFRLADRAVALVGAAAARRPLVIVLDDLHWADAGALDLLAHLVRQLPARTAVIGALRNRGPTPGVELTRTLVAVGRVPGHRRIPLGPLEAAEVAGLVRRETGREPGADVLRGILAHTGGNAFFVRELARHLVDGGPATAGAAAWAGVPGSVRDVVRDRMGGLDPESRALLEMAACVGRDVELALLARAADLDVPTCLARLEPAMALGVLDPVPGDPFSYRFAHDLVRQAVAEVTAPTRVPVLHLRVADALAPTDVERLAQHLWAAGPLVDPARTVSALVGSGRLAAVKSALDVAERRLRDAVGLARAADLVEQELAALAQLIAVVGMRVMYGTSAVDLLERAEDLARRLGREREATVFLYSLWTAYAQALETDRSRAVARRLLRQGEASTDPHLLAYGLQAWGVQRFSDGHMDEAFTHLSAAHRIRLTESARRADDPVGFDLQLLTTGMLAESTAMHADDLDGARALLDRLEAAGDDPFTVTVWATHTVRMESVVGDPDRALRAAERGIAADPDFSFAFLGTYQRLIRLWALALTGTDPAGAAAEAERFIATHMVDPPRGSLATCYGHLAEAWLAAGSSDAAAAALDRADACLDRYDQRYPEALLLLLRARVLKACGASDGVVRAVAERGRAVAVDRGTRLFARRTAEFLATLDGG
ncbi:BTAD domain-containing putative transcriptional regulator [Pseudonocardia sp. CA-107938]|uniref:BTAD domain-containing putative transcriptional regulator n=1 Tax=Pseudonocardia sp. CA-107938 TaxID=3240021 RepID=UPI003D8BE3A2